MNNQLIQKEQKESPVLEPISAESPQSDTIPSLPTWISSSYSLITKEFEIELLNYIFKNQNTHPTHVLDHFVNQLPQNIENKNIIIKSMQSIARKVLEEPMQPEIEPKSATPPAKISKKDLPNWIDHATLNILRTDLIDAIMNYFSKNSDADNDAILHHLMTQLPANMLGKRLIHGQIKAIIEGIFDQ